MSSRRNDSLIIGVTSLPYPQVHNDAERFEVHLDAAHFAPMEIKVGFIVPPLKNVIFYL